MRKVSLFLLLTALSAKATDVVLADSVYEVAMPDIEVTAVKGVVSQGAVSRFGEGELERNSVKTFKGVSEMAPNFYVPDYGTRMTSTIYVRGIGSRIDQPAVGLTVDNVSLLNKDAYDLDLSDIAHMEVLRGPRSTLFGRNTMGGVVSVTTLSPLTYEGLRVTAEGGSGGLFRGNVGYYTRIGSRWGVSVSGSFNRLGGFFTNEYNGQKADREEGGSVRVKAVWQPSAGLLLENTASWSTTRQHGYAYQHAETRRIEYNDTAFYKRTLFTDGLTVSWRGRKGIGVTSVTTVQYIDDNMTLDQDFLPEDYFTLTQKRHELALTQDVVVKGQRGIYNWLGGGYVFMKTGEMSAPVTFKSTGIARLIEGKRNEINPTYPIKWDYDEFPLNSDFDQGSFGAALYHRSGFEVGQFTFRGELRLDYERPRLDYRSYCKSSYTIMDHSGASPTVYGHREVVIDNEGRLTKDYLELLPRLEATWQATTNLTVSVSAAKGYKAGGYNVQMFSDVLQQRVMSFMGLTERYDIESIVSYKPEKSWNYEINAEYTGRGNGLHGSLTLFYIDCRDQQLTTFPDGTTTGRIMTNAGKTRSLGVEIQGSYNTGGWVFSGSYGFTDARFRDYDNGIEKFDGKRVPYAPSNTVYLSGSYTARIGEFVIEPTVTMRGVGDIYWDEGNSSHQKFYGLLGARIGVSYRKLTIAISGENLTNTKYDTFSYVSIGNTFYQRGKPARAIVSVNLTL